MRCAQGLLGRPDWQKAAAIPFALLPAGSGNALAANTGMWNLTTALHAVIKVCYHFTACTVL